jgi:hypothetical protein
MDATANTERCQVKCNPGYEHPFGVNLFEECGPNTDWSWSQDINDEPIFGCVGEFKDDALI